MVNLTHSSNKPMNFILVLASVSVGDHSIFGLPSALICFIASVIFILMFQKRYLYPKLYLYWLSSVVLLLTFNFFLQRYSYAGFEYYLSCLFLSSVFPLIARKNFFCMLRNSNFAKFLFFICLLYLVTNGDRGFIFGPNVLYRVLYFISIILFGTLTIYVASLVAMATLSRGAVATYFFFGISKKPVFFSLIIFVVILSAILLNEYSRFLPRFLIFYDVGGSNSVGDRAKIMFSVNLETLLYGMPAVLNEYTFIKYPHNSVIESIWMFGIFSFLFWFPFVICFLKTSNYGRAIMILLIVPTFFSGGFLDNILWLSFALSSGLILSDRKGRLLYERE